MTQLFSHTDAPDPAAAPAAPEPDGAPERDAEHDYALPAAPPPPPTDAPAVPTFAGTYAVYDDHQGGVVLVLAPHGGEIVQKHIPAAAIKFAERFGGMGAGISGLFGGH